MGEALHFGPEALPCAQDYKIGYAVVFLLPTSFRPGEKKVSLHCNHTKSNTQLLKKGRIGLQVAEGGLRPGLYELGDQ